MPLPLAIYVHFPYCAVRCPYCDFAVTTERHIPQERYTRAVLAELALRAASLAPYRARTLYLGGGTPSLWDPERVAAVVAAVRTVLGLPVGAEVTLEANPESADAGRLAAFRAGGVNRFSIGVQSFDPAVLAKLGRRHGPEAAERAVRAAAAVTDDVSVDLIYGARRSSVATARADAARLAALPVAHVSAYALTLDPDVLATDVPLARMLREGRLPLPPEEDVLAQARALRAGLRRAGFRRYEVSNFARPGHESLHNATYWESGSYAGLGVGAVGCLHAPRAPKALRWANHRATGAYLEDLEAGRLPTASEERLGSRELLEERILLALRTRRGLPLDELPRQAGADVAELVRRRLAVRAGGHLVLTSRGLDLHGAIAERLVPRAARSDPA